MTMMMLVVVMLLIVVLEMGLTFGILGRCISTARILSPVLVFFEMWRALGAIREGSSLPEVAVCGRQRAIRHRREVTCLQRRVRSHE